ncbi:RNA polymerase sigma factor [Mucilaginibacter sp.]|uniref:RNA polymerase sigma factor n=1 Tax=Mucilaginibacter sp. TaxID=1882438 RepID=UPI003B001C55
MEPARLAVLNFDCLFEQYKKRIYIYVLKLVKSPFLAEEVTQEIFIKLWLYRDKLAGINNLDGFVFKIVRNQALNHLRKVACDERLLKEILAFATPEQNNVDEKLIAADYQLLVQQALDCLSPQRRLVYELSRKKGLDHEEIAIQLNLSRNTVKNHIVSALKHIHNYLSKNGISIAILLLFLR